MDDQMSDGPMRRLRRVGIIQRPMALAERDEVRDTLDVRLARLVWDLAFIPIPITNAVAQSAGLGDGGPSNVDDYLSALALDAIVLSGGDDVGEPPARDRTERAALALAERERLPVLGICRGMQLINVMAGGMLTPVEGHVAARHEVQGSPIAKREVNSFHRLAILPDGLAADLKATAWAPDGTVEAVKHRRLPWTGIMWHPEREAPFAEDDVKLVTDALTGLHG